MWLPQKRGLRGLTPGQQGETGRWASESRQHIPGEKQPPQVPARLLLSPGQVGRGIRLSHFLACGDSGPQVLVSTDRGKPGGRGSVSLLGKEKGGQ